MAKRLNHDPFTDLKNMSYGQLFDGSTWSLAKGEDFDLAPSTVVAKIRDAWHREYGELQIKADGDTVYVRHVK